VSDVGERGVERTNLGPTPEEAGHEGHVVDDPKSDELSTGTFVEEEEKDEAGGEQAREEESDDI
jgi:hypothetical protein